MKGLIFYRLSALAGLLLLSTVCFSAEIGLSRQEVAGASPPVSVAAIIISGQIQAGDASKVEALVSQINQYSDHRQILRLLIHSPGGLIGEAMKIGKLLRANGFEVFIPRETRCISACVLILAGGATRTIQGQVGIDNPHFLRAAGPGDNVPALLAESKHIMREYYRSMGVLENLSDATFTVPPGAVHFLDQNELTQYHLTASGSRQKPNPVLH